MPCPWGLGGRALMSRSCASRYPSAHSARFTVRNCESIDGTINPHKIVVLSFVQIHASDVNSNFAEFVKYCSFVLGYCPYMAYSLMWSTDWYSLTVNYQSLQILGCCKFTRVASESVCVRDSRTSSDLC